MKRKKKKTPKEPTCCSCMHVEDTTLVFRCRLTGKAVDAFGTCPHWDTSSDQIFAETTPDYPED
jgi:hypothetical protein